MKNVKSELKSILEEHGIKVNYCEEGKGRVIVFDKYAKQLGYSSGYLEFNSWIDCAQYYVRNKLDDRLYSFVV